MSDSTTPSELPLDGESTTFSVSGATESPHPSPDHDEEAHTTNSGSEPSGFSSLTINVVLPLSLLAAAAIVVLLLGSVQPAQRPPIDQSRIGRLKALPAVRVKPVRSLAAMDTQLELRVDGSVVPFREAQIAAEVAGNIVYKSPKCEAGTFVKQGTVLMRIDRTDYELEVQRLTRLQEQEYQAIAEVDQEMVNIGRLIAVAEQDVALQQKDVDRQRALPQGFSSPAEIDRAERALLASKQQLVTLQNQLDLQRKRRVRLEASEKLAATQLRAADVNLKRTEVVAPIDGVIVQENAEVNNFVARGSPLVMIEDTSKVEVAVSLRMDQLYWILDQQTSQPTSGNESEVPSDYDLPPTDAIIEYEMSGRNNTVYRWTGKLLRYDGIGLDSTTRTVPVRIVVDTPRQYFDEDGKLHDAVGPNALVRGMYVQARLRINPKTPLVVVPAEAMKPGNRVWQFVPDESVLDKPIEAGTDETADKEQHTDSDQPIANSQATKEDPEAEEKQDPSPENSFDPAEWMAGRVLVRRSVTPVDSLTIATQSDRRTDEYTAVDPVNNRWWVCEIGDDSIVDGSYVVISQLSAVDEQGLDVRAQQEDKQ